jgi:hypothetical protein
VPVERRRVHLLACAAQRAHDGEKNAHVVADDENALSAGCAHPQFPLRKLVESMADNGGSGCACCRFLHRRAAIQQYCAEVKQTLED